MRKGLFPLIAGVLIVLWLLSHVFEAQINTANALIQTLLIGTVVLIMIGVVLLALWDTKIIGNKK